MSGTDNKKLERGSGSELSRSAVTRAVEKTTDKHARTKPSAAKSSRSEVSASTGALPTKGHTRMFGLGKEKGKEKESAARTHVPMTGRRSSLDDDSPFIQPRSPTRADLSLSFRGDSSMRIGTQALIRALQAIPWEEDADNEEEAIHERAAAQDADDSAGSDEHTPEESMTSSIHAIHRRLGRSRVGASMAKSKLNQLPSMEESPSDAEQDATSDVAEDAEDNDFEPRDQVQVGSSQSTPRPSGSIIAERLNQEMQSSSNRSVSIATVRMKRRARLADKLRDVFEVPHIHEVITELPCWLFRSILLQGYMYLTNSYLCFFAHMPSKEDQVLKSGMLHKRAQRTKRWIKHWFVLKNDVLSWYQSSADPYFPHGVVDLRYAISCEPIRDKEIRLRTNTKTVTLYAEASTSRDEWVKAIRRVMFKSQLSGDNIKIALPYSAILDVDKSTAIDFSDTIEVKIVDKDDNHSVDSYFFAYFRDLPGALEQIRDVIRQHRVDPDIPLDTHIMDTTAPRTPVSPSGPGRPLPDAVGTSHPSGQGVHKSSSMFRLPSILKPIQESLPGVRTHSTPATPVHAESHDDFTHISKGSSFVPVTSDSGSRQPLSASPRESSDRDSRNPLDHTYPPGTVGPPSREMSTSSSGSWTVPMPSWLKGTARRTSSSASSTSAGGVSVIYSGSRPRPPLESLSSELGYSVLEHAGSRVDPEAQSKFRETFALDEKEHLLGYFSGNIYRVIPVSGKLYVSTNYFCFKASSTLSKTKMILPIRDLFGVEKSKGFHFGRYGLVINLRAHEELFFEFSYEDRRSAFIQLLEMQVDDVRKRLHASGTMPPNPTETRDALIFDEYESRPVESSNDGIGYDQTLSRQESLPTHMFTSASSTFLTFKPEQPLHFTCLTIGSRGDVQPYIALAKGLMADGHRVRIATHGEFREWIESHGIEYAYVGGDPAELMRICIENGTFTVAFLKEGLLKFRGWLDDLLKTSWEACQGTDVLIESPSAMAGLHIAEALRIPYFRAFTMTWTRTRAYPHAFAVPERKMGGGYNYMTFVMFDQVFWRAISGQINRWRRNTLGLHGTSLDKMEPHKVPFLYNFSPTLVPPPLDWPEWIRVTGYWFLEDAEVSAQKWTPPPELVEFIDSAHAAGKKVVYIGFGSIVVSDPASMTRAVVEAVVRSGVYAILAKGWSDRLQTKATGAEAELDQPLPKQIYSIQSIPHDWLFARIDAACHHGGAGTTGASLRAGIPTIIKPFFGDQFFWADRVEAMGIGAGVRNLTADALTEALQLVTTDEKQVRRAKVVGAKIRAENGVANAVEAIYRDLEYARSLIKRRADEDTSSDAEDATIREADLRDHGDDDGDDNAREHHVADSSTSSCGSAPEASDWSVISDGDGALSSSPRSIHREDSIPESPDRPKATKRGSLAAAVFSVLPVHTRPHSPRSASSPGPSSS